MILSGKTLDGEWVEFEIGDCGISESDPDIIYVKTDELQSTFIASVRISSIYPVPDEDDLVEFANLCRQYSDPATILWEQVFKKDTE